MNQNFHCTIVTLAEKTKRIKSVRVFSAVWRTTTFALIFEGPYLNDISRLINIELMSSSKTILVYSELKVHHDVRKHAFEGLGATRAQTSLCICAVWSAPLLFAFWKMLYLTWYRWDFNFLSSLCSCGEWFESRFVGNPEDRFFSCGGPFNFFY